MGEAIDAEGRPLPSPPGDADESRVASLRSAWAAIVPAGPVEYQTGWQIAKPDVMYLLGLAEQALRQRRAVPIDVLRLVEARRLNAILARLVGRWGKEG